MLACSPDKPDANCNRQACSVTPVVLYALAENLQPSDDAASNATADSLYF